MNIEYLKLFVRLAMTHNISQAGQELGISPAVASTHINKLEAGLGVRLPLVLRLGQAAPYPKARCGLPPPPRLGVCT